MPRGSRHRSPQRGRRARLIAKHRVPERAGSTAGPWDGSARQLDARSLPRLAGCRGALSERLCARRGPERTRRARLRARSHADLDYDAAPGGERRPTPEASCCRWTSSWGVRSDPAPAMRCPPYYAWLDAARPPGSAGRPMRARGAACRYRRSRGVRRARAWAPGRRGLALADTAAMRFEPSLSSGVRDRQLPVPRARESCSQALHQQPISAVERDGGRPAAWDASRSARHPICA